MFESSIEADDFSNGLIIFVNRKIFAEPDIHKRRQFVKAFDCQPNTICQIARVHEFTPRRAVAPNFNLRFSVRNGLNNFLNHGGDHMRPFARKFIPASVNIAGNQRFVLVFGIFSRNVTAHFGARNFCERVAFICRLKFARQNHVFGQRRFVVARIHAGGAEIQKFFYARPISSVNYIAPHIEIFKQKFQRLLHVRRNAADNSRRMNHQIGTIFFQIIGHGVFVKQIQFLMARRKQFIIFTARRLQNIFSDQAA